MQDVVSYFFDFTPFAALGWGVPGTAHEPPLQHPASEVHGAAAGAGTMARVGTAGVAGAGAGIVAFFGVRGILITRSKKKRLV